MRLLLHGFIGKKEAVVISLFICLAWTPSIYSIGNDVVLYGELFLPLILFVLPVHKVRIPRYLLLYLLPFLMYLNRDFFLIIIYGRVDIFELLISAKQLEYFFVLLIGFIVGKYLGTPKTAAVISYGFAISYLLFIFASVSINFGTLRLASIPVKPGAAIFISGFYAVLPIFFSAVSFLKNRKLLFNIAITVLAIITAILTFSRSNLFGLVITFSFAALILMLTNSRRRGLLFLAYLIALTASARLILEVLPWSYKGLTGIGITNLFSLLQGDSSWAARQGIVQEGLYAFQSELGVMDTLFGSYSLQTRRIWDNQYAKLFFELGLVGTLAYMLPLMNLLRRTITDKGRSREFGLSVMLILLHLLVISYSAEVLTNTYVVMTPMYAIFGLYLGTRDEDNNRNNFSEVE